MVPTWGENLVGGQQEDGSWKGSGEEKHEELATQHRYCFR